MHFHGINIFKKITKWRIYSKWWKLSRNFSKTSIFLTEANIRFVHFGRDILVKMIKKKFKMAAEFKMHAKTSFSSN
jgi:hypothetical protein